MHIFKQCLFMLGWHLQSVTICNGFVSFIPRKRGTPSEAPLFRLKRSSSHAAGGAQCRQESWGHTIPGTLLLLDGYKDELKPVFKSTPTQFQTIIYATSDTQNVGDHDGDMSETKLTEYQQKILNLIKESPTITGRQMSETLSVSQRTIERDLSALQKVGALMREGKDNDGKWVNLFPKRDQSVRQMSRDLVSHR